ncbi:MAG TPA: FAD-binding oxidoreductase [Solirubrobacteraceae bacterium]|nr:FAD-binding oxidoreductase [Solirubrobacteraceae bacterium]
MTPAATLDALRSRLNGKLVAPSDPGFDEARLAWNLAADQRPAAIAFPESADDVVAAVSPARESGLRVAAQGTGHGSTAMESLEATLLLKTSRMRGLAIDPATRRARVEPGVLWEELSPAAAQHGLAGLQGSAGDVAVTGYSLGGGLSWMARAHGWAANRIVAADVVTADGELMRADREDNPDLFWALRGGGGSFGVVTALEIELVPVAELYAGVLFWPQERAAEVLPAWRDWAATVPDEMTSLGRLLNVPPLPQVPEFVRGKSFVVVEAAFLGTEAQGAELLAPLRALEPAMDTFATIAPPALVALHMDPPEPVPGESDGFLVGELPDAGIQAILDATGPGTGSPLVSLELRALGGAIGRHDPDGGAANATDARYAEFAVGMAMTPEMKQAVAERLDAVREAVAGWATGGHYMNFCDRATDRETMFPPETYTRLREVKRAYDPDDLFQANHPIPPG